MLKVEFHAHTNYLQPNEGKMSPKELIDAVKDMGYDALTITEHYNKNSDWDIYRKDPLKTYRDFKDYAKKKGILLIPGAEIQLKEGEVVLVNFTGKAEDYETLEDLKKLPKSTMILAAHPFFILAKQCLGPVLEEKISYFDAVEYCHFYTTLINMNDKAVAIAKKHNKPIVCTSDVHRKVQLNRNYTLVDSKKSIEDIIKAVRQNKIERVTKPLSPYLFTKLTALTCWCGITKLLRKSL